MAPPPPPDRDEAVDRDVENGEDQSKPPEPREANPPVVAPAEEPKARGWSGSGAGGA